MNPKHPIDRLALVAMTLVVMTVACLGPSQTLTEEADPVKIIVDDGVPFLEDGDDDDDDSRSCVLETPDGRELGCPYNVLGNRECRRCGGDCVISHPDGGREAGCLGLVDGSRMCVPCTPL